MNWTLDFKEILHLYSSIINCTSYEYHNYEFDIHIKVGNEICHHTMVLDHEFGVLKLPIIPAFIPMYPLRNACLYHRALKMAHNDPLTGVMNRYTFLPTLERECKNIQRHGYPLSLIFLDLDDFKKINDKHGHDYGDVVLKNVADIIQQTTRSTDFVFRYGGEEFVIILPNTDINNAVLLCSRLLNNVKSTITASIGVTLFKDDDNIHSFIKRADDAMYKAKNNGKNQIQIL